MSARFRICVTTAAAVFAAASAFADVVIGTWNGGWFPSGRAEHRANAKVEAATIRAAGELFAKGFAALDPERTNDWLICVNEVRDRESAEALRAAIGRADLRLAVISGYRVRREKNRFDYQQDALMTTLPTSAATWSRWKSNRALTPPRGYVFAEVALPNAVTAAVYGVHLKSNYAATTPAIREANTAKRDNAIAQLVEQETPKRGRTERPVVILGDFNADRWSDEFAEDRLFTVLENAGFLNPLSLLPPERRGTHPGRGRWKDSALDYVMLRGLTPVGEPVIVSSDELSDHSIVFVRVKGP